MTIIVASAAVVILFATGLAGTRIEVVGANVCVAIIHACLVGVAKSTARTPGLAAPTRRFWRSVAVAGVIYLVGDVAQVVVAVRDPFAATSATGGTAELIALSAGSAWLMLTLLTVPLNFDSQRERARFWMDVATVMVAAVVVGWYLVIPDQPAALLHAAAPVLAGPVVLLLCVFVVAKLVMSGTAPFTKACGLIGAGGAAVKSGADAMSRGGLADDRLHWFLACTVAAHALLVIALRINQIQLSGARIVTSARRRKPYSPLPYVAIAVTYLLLIVAVARHQPQTVPVALAGAAVSTLLVVLRQLAAFRDNSRLLAELDAKVHELRVTQDGLHTSLAQRDALAARLHHDAFHDGLTGLPNRALFAERLDTALATGGDVVTMLIDLDGFKQVNDRWGHAAGDTLLGEVAHRLRACLRPTDTVARIGGDEFVILLSAPPAEDPAEIAARIIRTIEAPVLVDAGSWATVGASVGIAISDETTQDGASLLRRADHAMYAVKRSGKGTFALAQR